MPLLLLWFNFMVPLTSLSPAFQLFTLTNLASAQDATVTLALRRLHESSLLNVKCENTSGRHPFSPLMSFHGELLSTFCPMLSSCSSDWCRWWLWRRGRRQSALLHLWWLHLISATLFRCTLCGFLHTLPPNVVIPCLTRSINLPVTASLLPFVCTQPYLPATRELLLMHFVSACCFLCGVQSLLFISVTFHPKVHYRCPPSVFLFYCYFTLSKLT